MKKLLFCLLALALLLAGCTQTQQATTPEPTREAMPVITPVATPVPAQEPVLVAWDELYADALLAYLGDDPEMPEHFPARLNLVDMDFDGIPEMLLSERGASMRWLEAGFTVRDGHVVPLDVVNVFLYDPPALYRDDARGTLAWINQGENRDGARHIYHSLLRLRLEGNALLADDLLFWNEIYPEDSDEPQYSLMIDYEDVPSTLEEVQDAQEALFTGTTLLSEAGGASIDVEALLPVDTDTPFLTHDTFDRTAFLAYCTTWAPIAGTP